MGNPGPTALTPTIAAIACLVMFKDVRPTLIGIRAAVRTLTPLRVAVTFTA